MRQGETRSRKFAKGLRRRLTNAETILWSRLRCWRAHGVAIRRQHPIGPYIADFACVPTKLVIEVDGETHGSDTELAHDHRRDAYLRSRGWRVIRIRNEDVYNNLNNLNNLLDMLLDQVPPPSSSAALRRTPPP